MARVDERSACRRLLRADRRRSGESYRARTRSHWRSTVRDPPVAPTLTLLTRPRRHLEHPIASPVLFRPMDDSSVTSHTPDGPPDHGYARASRTVSNRVSTSSTSIPISKEYFKRRARAAEQPDDQRSKRLDFTKGLNQPPALRALAMTSIAHS